MGALGYCAPELAELEREHNYFAVRDILVMINSVGDTAADHQNRASLVTTPLEAKPARRR